MRGRLAWEGLDGLDWARLGARQFISCAGHSLSLCACHFVHATRQGVRGMSWVSSSNGAAVARYLLGTGQTRTEMCHVHLGVACVKLALLAMTRQELYFHQLLADLDIKV